MRKDLTDMTEPDMPVVEDDDEVEMPDDPVPGEPVPVEKKFNEVSGAGAACKQP